MPDRTIMHHALLPIWAALLLSIASSPAPADTYPVSGTWTYDNPRAEGPAPDCGARYMRFEGNQRRDTGGSVPAFRNFSVEANGEGRFRVVDQFASGQINARQSYVMRVVDKDHLELTLSSGQTIALRRCG